MKTGSSRYRLVNIRKVKLAQATPETTPRWIQEGTRDVPVTLAAVGTVAALAIFGALVLR